ncbi:DNA-binding transcriptional regulator, LysR family [Verrucomicrobium sp. GAS474]|uniref:LysR family transcriptional regulator n=1 Tax=Verrucomicrobium sp. GAS474 TaxID=1882831 RepID=UPI00087C2041|nr:LysR substrate-binding domain-containing protein [Verrucomicrobium sp. GAS474]SDT85849.1 DNA-binding transcriptional regulator, LysR family [Verrucomicrobium sp. GAS474]
MELRHLRYFVAVAEEENVSRAALKLHVSQPALSRQIRDLEDEIGFALFERDAKSLRLTEAGRVFLPESWEVIRRAGEAVTKARAVALGSGSEIAVGYAPSLTFQILPKALRAFQEKMPNVRVALHDLSTEEMLFGLLEGKLQAALLPKPTGGALRRLNYTEIARYALCAAVAPGHPLVAEMGKKKSLPIARAAQEPLVAYTRKDYPDYHDLIDRTFAPLARKPRIAEEHDGVTSLLASVESGRGLALLPESIVDMVGPRLVLFPLVPAPAPASVGLAWRKEEAGKALGEFIAACSTCSGKIGR